MTEVHIDIRQALQPQAAEIQFKADGGAVIGQFLRCFTSPATDDPSTCRRSIVAGFCVDQQPVRANIPLAVAASRKNPGVQLSFQGAELQLETRQSCADGTLLQAPDIFPAHLDTFERIQTPVSLCPGVIAVKCRGMCRVHQFGVCSVHASPVTIECFPVAGRKVIALQ